MTRDDGFTGRVAVVTGGGRGMGRAHCIAFAERGVKVVAADILAHSAEETARLINEQGGQALGVALDVSDEGSVADLFRDAEGAFGRVDFLVNNAAIMLDIDDPFKPFWTTSVDEWDRVMAVNVRGVFLGCKYVKPIMARQRSGRIVNIGSDAVWKGYESQLAYFASKGAVTVMTRNLARELGEFMITVNCVAPGYTRSEAVLASEFMQSVMPLIMKSCCIKREQNPSDVSGAVLFLCSPDAACITGQSIVVNCGAIMP